MSKMVKKYEKEENVLLCYVLLFASEIKHSCNKQGKDYRLNFVNK